jgi:hypothetical protein
MLSLGLILQWANPKPSITITPADALQQRYEEALNRAVKAEVQVDVLHRHKVVLVQWMGMLTQELEDCRGNSGSDFGRTASGPAPK